MNPANLLTESLVCAAVSLSATATGELMYMPGGLQTITPAAGGIKKPILVQVDPSGATALEAQRAALVARGKRPYFDFNHDDAEASFWPESFHWKEVPEPGIYARGEWTASGRAGVEGKEWRQFSPAFHVDKKAGTNSQNPARIVCEPQAKPNMGGLVNDAAFHTILPLWAKNAGASGDDQQQPNPRKIPMLTETEIAALQAKNQELEATDKRRRTADAADAVNRAVARGVIAAKDDKAQERWKQLITENPDNAELLAAQSSSPALGGMLTKSHRVAITKESPNAVMKEFGAIIARNASIHLSHQTFKEKGRLAREAAALFAKEINDDPVISGMTAEDAIQAADYSDPGNNAGLLSGTLVLQRALPLMRFEYPMLSTVFTDFSDEPGLYKQTQVTRIVLKPSVQSYDATADADGRPRGWRTVSPAQAIDVPITLDEYVAVPIVFGVTSLASTVRNLFGEVAPMAMYAIGGYFVDKMTALMTPANFNAYAGTSVAGGATTNTSATITVASTAGMYPGQFVSGTGIPASTFVLSITDATHAVLNHAATATNTGLTFTLGTGKVPIPYATYVKAVASFTVASLDEIASAFDNNEVPQSGRSAMLNAAYYRALKLDPSISQYFAAAQSPEIITKGLLPEVGGFNLQKAPYFPASNSRVGFAYHKAAIALKSRLPMDFISASGTAAPGTVTTITDPSTGISVALVQRIDLTGNYAEWRPEIMLGAAVGERRAGMVITSS